MSSRSSTVAAVSLLVLLAGARVEAQPAAERSRARTLLTEGDRLLTRKDYTGALARFQEAYALVPSPKIHFNFGLAYRGLARHADAHRAFEEFLRAGTDAPADKRQEARTLSREQADRCGRLEVSSNVDGAEILVDDRIAGQSPLAAPIVLDPGPHDVTVRHAETPSPHRERVVISRGQTARVSATLVRTSPGRLVLLPPPPPASTPAVDLALQQAPAAPPPASPPFYRRVWFWGAVGAVVVAGVVTAFVLTRSDDPCRRAMLPNCIPVQ